MIRAHSTLAVSLLFGALPLAACVEPTTTSTEQTSTAASSSAQAIDPSADLEATAAVEDVGQGCGRRTTFTLAADADPGSNLLKDLPDTAAACLPPDIYFHPNNGAHGGWIESWRLCYQGGSTYQICTGGSAPVRFWNPSSCNGSVQDFYPQGWHGTAQTGGGCC
jgi:hypothetical protein